MTRPLPAGAPRKRRGLSCLACRQSKTACDGASPGELGDVPRMTEIPCSRCERLKQECYWRTNSRNRRDYDQANGIPAPASSLQASPVAVPVTFEAAHTFSMPSPESRSSWSRSEASPRDTSPSSPATNNPLPYKSFQFKPPPATSAPEAGALIDAFFTHIHPFLRVFPNEELGRQQLGTSPDLLIYQAVCAIARFCDPDRKTDDIVLSAKIKEEAACLDKLAALLVWSYILYGLGKPIEAGETLDLAHTDAEALRLTIAGSDEQWCLQMPSSALNHLLEELWSLSTMLGVALDLNGSANQLPQMTPSLQFSPSSRIAALNLLVTCVSFSRNQTSEIQDGLILSAATNHLIEARGRHQRAKRALAQAISQSDHDFAKISEMEATVSLLIVLACRIFLHWGAHQKQIITSILSCSLSSFVPGGWYTLDDTSRVRLAASLRDAAPMSGESGDNASADVHAALEILEVVKDDMKDNPRFQTTIRPPFCACVFVVASITLLDSLLSAQDTQLHYVLRQSQLLLVEEALCHQGEFWPVAAQYSALLKHTRLVLQEHYQ